MDTFPPSPLPPIYLSPHCQTTMSSYSSEEVSRFSMDSTESRPAPYKSRFHEHISQAYVAPPEDWPQYTPAAPTKSKKQKRHKNTPSIDSFASSISTSSITSMERLKKFAFKTKSSGSFSGTEGRSTPQKEFYQIKGSKKSFSKEDIKVGGLTGSTNMVHYI